jgi:signal peptidase I
LIQIPADTPISPGDVLLVCRNLELGRPLARWDLIACQDPESPENVIVKRLVGLPGETVQIIDGDIFINGQIARKSLDQQASTAALVYDAGHESDGPLPELPRRWIASPKNSRWSATEGHFRFAETEKEKTSVREADRLTYHHRCQVDGRMVAGAVVDRLAYNQWLPIRRDTFNPVPDLMLAFHLRRTAGEGHLNVFTADDRYLVTFDYAKKKVLVKRVEVKLTHSQIEPGKSKPEELKASVLAEAPFDPPLGSTPVPILISTVDRGLMVVVDQNVLIEEPLPEALPCSSTPFSLEAVGLGLDISRVRVYRDVYYVRPVGINARWALDKPVHLGEDEYFILGDNSQVSQDSRTWASGPAIRRPQLFGRP